MRKALLTLFVFVLLMAGGGLVFDEQEEFDAGLDGLIYAVLNHSMVQKHGDGVFLGSDGYEIKDVSHCNDYYEVSVELRPYSELYPVVSRDEAVLHISETGIGVLRYRVLEDYQEG